MPATANLGRVELAESTAQKNVHLADGFLLLTVIFWSINFSLVKFALVELSPLAFNGLRMLLAAGLMLILVPMLGYSLKFQRHHLGQLIVLGLLGNTAYQLCFIFGIARTSADNAALILATVPVWVALIGTIGWHRKSDRRRMAGGGTLAGGDWAHHFWRPAPNPASLRRGYPARRWPHFGCNAVLVALHPGSAGACCAITHQ